MSEGTLFDAAAKIIKKICRKWLNHRPKSTNEINSVINAESTLKNA